MLAIFRRQNTALLSENEEALISIPRNLRECNTRNAEVGHSIQRT